MRNGGFSASYDSFVVGSSAVLRLNFCAKIRHYAKPQTGEYFKNVDNFLLTAKNLWKLRPYDKAIRLLGLSLSNLNTNEKKQVSVQLKIPFEEY